MPTKTLGAAADALFRQREKIREKEAELKKLKQQLDKDSDTFMKRMNTSEVATVKGRLCQITISQQQVYSPKDWDALYKYIHRYKAYDLLQRRLSSTAYKDRLEAGKKVPGVSSFTLYKPHITKRKS